MLNTAVVEVKRNPNESTASLVRRFTKRVNSAGVLKTVRANRYASRPQSSYVKKKSALKRLERQQEYKRLYKLGKILDRNTSRYGRG